MSVQGKSRIVKLPGYESGYADTVEPPYILFEDGRGEFAFEFVTGAFTPGADRRRDYTAIAFDWTNNDEMDEVCGSGSVEFKADGPFTMGSVSDTATKCPSSAAIS